MSAEQENVSFEATIANSELPELVTHIAVFDQSRQQFLAAVTQYDKKPCDTTQANLGLCGSLLLKQFDITLVSVMANEPDPNAQVNMIATLMLQEDDERIA